MHYRYDNVITLRTFSKVYGLAGFRAGYGFAHDTLINNLLKIKLPFEPSWPAQVAALAGLADDIYIKETVKSCHVEMKKMETVFNELDLEYIPSAANFLTLVFDNEVEAELFNENMLHQGIIFRHLKGWGLPNCIRLTVGTGKENEYWIGCLLKMLSRV